MRFIPHNAVGYSAYGKDKRGKKDYHVANGFQSFAPHNDRVGVIARRARSDATIPFICHCATSQVALSEEEFVMSLRGVRNERRGNLICKEIITS